MSAISPPSLSPASTLREVLEQFPGAQRALFRRYHIGGCHSCAFKPEETLEALCARNNSLNVQEVIEHIRASHDQDMEMQITPAEVAELLRRRSPLRLLDIRTREEWDATRIEGAIFLTQEVLQETLGSCPKDQWIVIYDHRGTRSLDAAAYFLGQGFQRVRFLRGGIDAWSQEVDPSIPRYRLEQS
jgi:rhodanese-related sulfurtransferase